MTTQQIAHTNEVVSLHQRLLAGTSVRDRRLDVGGRQVHVLETGHGPPLVLLHGTGGPGLFLLPLLERLERVRAIAADRPGQGLSDPTELPRERFRRAAVAWIDRLLDVLELDSAALLGHSMGGLWSLWYTLARPERVRRLVLLGGTPSLPRTRVPLPFRVMVLPGVGALLQRMPSTPKSVTQFARLVGEGQTVVGDTLDVLVAAGNDRMAAGTSRDEARAIISPFAIVAPSRFRPQMRVQPEELQRVAAPTLLIWGDRDPVGDATVARATAETIPDARLEVLPAGHGPWLGHADRTADLVTDFVS